jgi:hypothetical protein
VREVTKKKNKPKKPKTKGKTMYQETGPLPDDLFDRCIRKGLIEKTTFGYYFTPEFFETLELYNEE